ncbi:MAG: hypothetical protein LAT54_02180 [Cryomorphaceae bacterium]|nr:hypothetical protein [Cryomorphaceae bacterium]
MIYYVANVLVLCLFSTSLIAQPMAPNSQPVPIDEGLMGLFVVGALYVMVRKNIKGK